MGVVKGRGETVAGSKKAEVECLLVMDGRRGGLDGREGSDVALARLRLVWVTAVVAVVGTITCCCCCRWGSV